VKRLITGGTVITMDNNRRVIDGGTILIEGDRIVDVSIGPIVPPPGGPDVEVIDATGCIVIPGLINAHTHVFQTLMRGLGDGLSFSNWQQEITYPLYQVLSPEDAYIFSLVGCIENLRSGVTSAINFQAYPNSADALNWTAKAFRESGLSGILVKSFFGANAPTGLLTPDLESILDEAEAGFNELQGDPLLKLWLGPPLPSQAPPEWIVAAHRVAASNGAGLHMHISESQALVDLNRSRLDGLGEIEYLDRLGVVDDHFHAAHCVAISDHEVALMAQRGAHVMHCPESNMYLASGVARIEQFRQSGVNVTICTDGPASNNNQNMFSAMKSASLLQRVTLLQPGALPPGLALEMATLNGARAMCSPDQGVLRPGARADVTIVKAQAAHTVVANRPVATLVYCAQPADVTTVLVAGSVVLRDGCPVHVDETALLQEAEDRAAHLLRKAGRSYLRHRTWPWA